MMSLNTTMPQSLIGAAVTFVIWTGSAWANDRFSSNSYKLADSQYNQVFVGLKQKNRFKLNTVAVRLDSRVNQIKRRNENGTRASSCDLFLHDLWLSALVGAKFANLADGQDIIQAEIAKVSKDMVSDARNCEKMLGIPVKRRTPMIEALK